MRRGSCLRLLSGDLGFVVEDRVTGADRDAAEGGDDLAVELFEPEQDVGLVHGLEVEVGADHTVAVDDRPAHVGPDFGSVGGLDRRWPRPARSGRR